MTTDGCRAEKLRGIRAELERSRGLSAYEAVVAWVALVKAANILSGQSEHERILSLLTLMPERFLRPVLHRPSVDTLLNLNPALESILTAEYERLAVSRTVRELGVARSERENNPKEALRSLAEVLKRIRNRRAHGFKTLDGPHDKEILEASSDILQALGEAAVDALERHETES